MAALDDLISQIPDESLRERIRAEVKRANRQKKFGLVFEEHLPEATPLYDIPVKRGSVVATKDGLWGDRIFEKCGIGRDEGGDGGKTLEIRGKRRLSARDGGANYQQS